MGAFKTATTFPKTLHSDLAYNSHYPGFSCHNETLIQQLNPRRGRNFRLTQLGEWNFSLRHLWRVIQYHVKNCKLLSQRAGLGQCLYEAWEGKMQLVQKAAVANMSIALL